ncbi:FtsK/SpoIIIE domain-containing protein [Vagococcus zengguangii]|uniref:DUF87 domain-containing protein n=1 Tax=Vagococcus zengguangii TaxID=2571750 RepID=A0A4D7CUX4_9ENTE|nr:FtsK/SpoIIIE domain-containing protein [Vagococcus zengguangii]QCI86902.1 DUF87 domain-containing protein [Vagococcus zengguangii]
MNNNIPLNNKYSWNLDTQPHCVVTGKTGSGKTQFIYYLILEAAKLTNEILIFDGKNGDLSNLTAVTIAQTTEEVVTELQQLVLIMKQRITTIKSKKLGNVTASEIGLSHIFCFVDELAAIMINAKKTDRKNKIANKENSKNTAWNRLKEDNTTDILDSLTELILVARQASIHLVLSTQHFDAKLLGDSQIRSNISMKVLLGQQTAQEYNMLNLTQEQLPNVDFSKIGAGVLMLDGLGWVRAKAYETPFIRFSNCTPNDILRTQINNHQLNNH